MNKISFSINSAITAGNTPEIMNISGNKLMVLYVTTYKTLTEIQKYSIEKYAEQQPLPIPDFETVGRGSVRCMIAEIFLPVT